jgi:hypothetical protein
LKTGISATSMVELAEIAGHFGNKICTKVN